MNENKNIMKNIDIQTKYSIPICVGSASRTPTNISNNSQNKNSHSLKDFSMSEIFKLAEERTKIAGISRQPVDPSRKRMIVSETVTRDSISSVRQILPREGGLTSKNNQLDDNEEFFENLWKKMTANKFIPNNKMGGPAKRARNKEDLNLSSTIKRRKKNRVNLPMPTTMPFIKRLLPQQNDTDSPTVPEIKYPCENMKILHQHKDIFQDHSTLDLLKENMHTKEFLPNFIDYDSSCVGAKRSLNESFLKTHIIEDNIFTPSYKTLSPQSNNSVQDIDYSSEDQILPCDYYNETHTRKLSNGSCFSTIEEYQEPFVVIQSPDYTVTDTDLDHSNISLRFTPPSTELAVGGTENCDEKEYLHTRDDCPTCGQLLI